MTQPPDTGRNTRVSQLITAPREVVYRAFLDPDAVASWLPPDGMKGHVYTFDPREGGRFRISLTYQNPADSPGGKTSADTDTAEGTFVELLPNEKIVWATEFES
ncbi:MAG: SRPBCC domain-containing protein, partial [Anaerolineae bacterium]|nr:SRPBCC domain-containing protein [Anaerolineae bacterium]